MRIFLNIVALQIGWFGCILGAAYDRPLLGPIVVVTSVALHLAFMNGSRGELLLLLLVAGLGGVLDTLVAASGALSFRNGWSVPWLAPLWMVALWMNFGTGLNRSLKWLLGRYGTACLLGAVGGPLAYYAGAGLGAVELIAPWSLLAVAVEWAFAMPVLVWLAARQRTWPSAAIPVRSGTAPRARLDIPVS
jgi:hypothetical protein